MSILKELLIISAAISAVFAFSSNRTTRLILDEWRERTKQEHPECLKSTGVKEEYVNQYWESLQMTDDENFKCYLWCVFKAFKLISNDGSANEEIMVQKMDRVTTDIVDFCSAKVDTTTGKCDRAYELIYCCLHYRHIYL
ncbi:general odorant-binding protein 69a-like [Photinus pyralis]|uniref:general odorant-binding protein 69a-like n=1 Tax=Photinus pyralis TaxID=7054 RepID=UPI001266F5B1|nr:general odorant-binding protein 69a-like [Photinus pyralis]